MKYSGSSLALVLGAALILVGCGDDDSSGSAGTGGDAGSGGTAGTAGEGGGGPAPQDPCADAPACIVCAQEALPPDIALFLPDGLRTPVTFTATPQGDVVQGATATIDVEAEVVVSLPLPAEGTINAGSTSSYAATAGGSGTIDVPVPEQDLAGQDLVIDGGSGSGEISVALDATELSIGLDSIVLDLSVTEPLMLDILLDASSTGLCSLEGEGVAIRVDPAP